MILFFPGGLFLQQLANENRLRTTKQIQLKLWDASERKGISQLGNCILK